MAGSKTDARTKGENIPIAGVTSPSDFFQKMTGYTGSLVPIGEDMRPDTSSDSGTDADAVAPRGELVQFSQTRLDREKGELKEAIDEVAELNPPRNGKPLTLAEINRWADKNITQDARERRPCASIRENWLDPEDLRKARIGPGTKIDDRVYRKLAHPRLAAKTEETQPETVAPDDEDDLSMDLDQAWKRKRVGTPEYLGQWTTYQASPPMYPKITNGVLSMSSSSPGGIFDHKPMPSKVENPEPYEQHEFKSNWGFWPSNHYDPTWFREQFFAWVANLPSPGHSVDIFHAAFFDGTASPDGGSAMMIMREKHGICDRVTEDEQTRLHWHETSAGYIWNVRTQMKEQAMIQIRQSRRTMAIRGTLGPSTQRLHHYLILRPGEPDDAEHLLPLFNWYAENTTFVASTTPFTQAGIQRLIQNCRDWKLPFIVAVPDRRVEVLERRPDEPEILGFAYVKRFNDEPSTGEVRVFVDHTCKKLHIGTGLVDMIMRTCDTRQSPDGYRPYEFKLRENLNYGDGYQCNLTSLVFAIAYEPSKEGKYRWVRSWLMRRFKFENLGHMKSGRVKFGHRLNVWLLSRGVWSGNPHIGKGGFEV
ncbi:hypothetical protein N7481_005408 [Penicillium waksmanii]|uniref:uncharacterized protein n=1 Tax=Penicillium waksmanii TaxID=69791 RepID=UPI0025483682|nr:uncharacterized protein N7481_005408 [Penicillium waksmanii]KAJ5983309.1 hypothetical protein N7481_005408 [Penicillium waksmanii]